MELYVLKTKNGYVKRTDPEKPSLVCIEKASVFTDCSCGSVAQTVEILHKQGEMDIRIARLTIAEQDYFKRV